MPKQARSLGAQMLVLDVTALNNPRQKLGIGTQSTCTW